MNCDIGSEVIVKATGEPFKVVGRGRENNKLIYSLRKDIDSGVVIFDEDDIAFVPVFADSKSPEKIWTGSKIKLSALFPILKEILDTRGDLVIAVNNYWDPEDPTNLKKISIDYDRTKVWTGEDTFLRFQ